MKYESWPRRARSSAPVPNRRRPAYTCLAHSLSVWLLLAEWLRPRGRARGRLLNANLYDVRNRLVDVSPTGIHLRVLFPDNRRTDLRQLCARGRCDSYTLPAVPA